MKNALLIAGLFLGSVAAAVVVWAAVGGSGGGRGAALVEPTGRGSIGELTIGAVMGARGMPIRSFDWHVVWVRDPQGAGGTVRYSPLEVLRGGGEVSPELFSFFTDLTPAPSAFLELRAPGASDPYLRYQLTNSRIAEYRGGRHEKLGFQLGLPDQAVDVRVGLGNAPALDPSDVIGYMTLSGEERVPILGFDSGFELQASRIHFDGAVIRRPLDQSARTLQADLVAQTVLGTVTIELQTSDESEPHVTYQLERNVKLVGLSASAAAGGTPTQELELTFQRIRVSQGRSSSACYDTFQGYNPC